MSTSEPYARATSETLGNSYDSISAHRGGRMLLSFTRFVSPTPEARRAPSNEFNNENPSDEPLTRKNFVGVLIINLTTSQMFLSHSMFVGISFAAKNPTVL